MTRRISLVATALVLALIGTFAVLTYVNRADARAVSGMDPVSAYVAEQSVSAGTRLKDAVDEKLIVAERLPRKTVPAGALLSVTARTADEVATTNIAEGELVMAARFGYAAVDTGGLPIPKGDLAVSLPLEDPQRVGGFVKPGSEIAVFDTYNTLGTFDANGNLKPGDTGLVAGDGLSDGHPNDRATRLLLPRVSVIGVGSSVAAPANLNKSADASNGQKSAQSDVVIVTVAVTQQQAEKLILAIQTGHLYLGLLTPDSNVAPSNGVDNASLFK